MEKEFFPVYLIHAQGNLPITEPGLIYSSEMKSYVLITKISPFFLLSCLPVFELNRKNGDILVIRT